MSPIQKIFWITVGEARQIIISVTLTILIATLTSSTEALVTGSQAVRIEIIASGLEVPWSIDFSMDGRIFLTERVGRIRVIEDGKLVPRPVAEIRVARVGEGGLLGLALHPDFQTNHYIYVYYTYRDSSGKLLNRVVRYVERLGEAVEERIILDGIPAAAIHDGGRIKFGPDGKLYVTTGDAGEPSLAQDLGSLAGKILRLNPDGSFPPDNPRPNSPVLSYGHRNPQGLAWHPITRMLYSTEHGPTANDEVNLILKGGNYGWPVVLGKAREPQYIDPIINYDITEAPSGATFYQGVFKDWRNSLFFASLRGQHVRRIVFAAPEYRSAVSDEVFLAEFGRMRDVVVGPDGFVYLATSNRDGRGSPSGDDDKILRVGLQSVAGNGESGVSGRSSTDLFVLIVFILIAALVVLSLKTRKAGGINRNQVSRIS